MIAYQIVLQDVDPAVPFCEGEKTTAIEVGLARHLVVMIDHARLHRVAECQGRHMVARDPHLARDVENLHPQAPTDSDPLQ